MINKVSISRYRLPYLQISIYITLFFLRKEITPNKKRDGGYWYNKLM